MNNDDLYYEQLNTLKIFYDKKLLSKEQFDYELNVINTRIKRSTELKKIIPVVTATNIEELKDILDALVNDGIMSAEICFRNDFALKGIQYAATEYPNVNVGAGTVICEQQAFDAINAGAKFIVSPGLSEDVACVCKEKKVPYYPGCVTPTEIMKALSLGLNILKFFPANVYGGLKAMKALSAPFPQVKFIPTGGIDSSNLDEYLNWDKIFAVGGSSFVKEALEKWKK